MMEKIMKIIFFILFLLYLVGCKTEVENSEFKYFHMIPEVEVDAGIGVLECTDSQSNLKNIIFVFYDTSTSLGLKINKGSTCSIEYFLFSFIYPTKFSVNGEEHQTVILNLTERE